MLAWKGKWIRNHTFRKDQQHHQRQQPSISLGKILILSLSQDSLPFFLSLSFHFHYLEKSKFPTASGNDTIISAPPCPWQQSLVTQCCVWHGDSPAENLPQTGLSSFQLWPAVSLLPCPQPSAGPCSLHLWPFMWNAVFLARIKLCISQTSS